MALCIDARVLYIEKHDHSAFYQITKSREWVNSTRTASGWWGGCQREEGGKHQIQVKRGGRFVYFIAVCQLTKVRFPCRCLFERGEARLFYICPFLPLPRIDTAERQWPRRAVRMQKGASLRRGKEGPWSFDDPCTSGVATARVQIPRIEDRVVQSSTTTRVGIASRMVRGREHGQHCRIGEYIWQMESGMTF